MWFLGVMCKPGTLVNSKEYIWSWVLCKIQHHSYNRSILVVTIYISLRTIRISSNMCLNLGGCWQHIKILHPYGLQDFTDQCSLKKLKSTIIQCLDINDQELGHWLHLWVFPIATRTILLEITNSIINIRLWTCPKQKVIHIYHKNHSLINEQAGIYLTQHKNSYLTNYFTTFHTRGVRLWIDHIGFSLIW